MYTFYRSGLAPDLGSGGPRMCCLLGEICWCKLGTKLGFMLMGCK